MKIVAFSDIHGQQSKKLTQWFESNPADLLIFAGDLQLNNQDLGIDFAKWLHNLPYTHKILIFGNHDGNSIDTAGFIINNKFDDIKVLNNKATVIDGIKIFGSPYSTRFGNWWFMKEDEELSKIWKTIPNDTNILVTHGPPWGILDDTCDGFLTGSKTLIKRVRELKKLKYHIFGHIQEAYGIKAIGEITFLNVSLLNEKYQFTNNPIIIDYSSGITETDYNVGE